MQRLLTAGKEASIRGSSTAHLVPPQLQKSALSKEVSSVDSERVLSEAASSNTVDLGVHVPPTDMEPAFHAVSADAKITPKLAPANKKAKSKTTAKTGAKGQTEQTTLTQIDLEARLDGHSIDKAQQQAIAARIEAANNAGSRGRGPPGLKCKPKAQALTVPSVAQLEQASQRTRSVKQ